MKKREKAEDAQISATGKLADRPTENNDGCDAVTGLDAKWFLLPGKSVRVLHEIKIGRGPRIAEDKNNPRMYRTARRALNML